MAGSSLVLGAAVPEPPAGKARVLRTLRSAAVTAAAVALAGCTSTGGGDRTPQAARPLFERLSGADLARADSAVQLGLETALSGVPTSWRNERTGTTGSVTAVRTWRTRNGRYCRLYEELIATAAERAIHTGAACRSAAGVWLPIENL